MAEGLKILPKHEKVIYAVTLSTAIIAEIYLIFFGGLAKADRNIFSYILFFLLYAIPFIFAVRKQFGVSLMFLFFFPSNLIIDFFEKQVRHDLPFWYPYGLSIALGGAIVFVLTLLYQFSENGGGTLGSARWSSSLGSHALIKGSTQFNLGRFMEKGKDSGKFFYQLGHILTCAPSGAGKGIGAVIPNLLEYSGSIFCVDIKGENWAVTHKTRADLWESNIILIDPFNFTEQDTRDSYNIFSWLSHFPDEITSDSSMIADALVVSSDNSENSFWEDSAKNVIRGFIAFISTYSDENIVNRNIGELRRLITLPPTALRSVLNEMSSSSITVVERCANTLISMDEKTLSGVLTTAQQHTAFLDEPRIADCLSSSSFDLEQFKTGNQTIYLVLPPEKLASNFRLVRLFISLLITSVTRSKEKPECPALFLFDEFAQLGKMTIVEDTLSLIRGYGAFYWFIIQDLSQLKAVYKKWQGFLSNSTKQFFATADYDTAKYLSDSLGQKTIEFETEGSSEGSSGGLNIRSGSSSSGSSTSGHVQARNLLNPDEILSLPQDIVIILNRGEKPYRLKRLNYLVDAEYQGCYEINPLHS